MRFLKFGDAEMDYLHNKTGVWPLDMMANPMLKQLSIGSTIRFGRRLTGAMSRLQASLPRGYKTAVDSRGIPYLQLIRNYQTHDFTGWHGITVSQAELVQRDIVTGFVPEVMQFLKRELGNCVARLPHDLYYRDCCKECRLLEALRTSISNLKSEFPLLLK